MTIKELIKALSDFPPDTVIQVANANGEFDDVWFTSNADDGKVRLFS